MIIALLTNRAWFEVGYTQKDKSSEQAIVDLAELSVINWLRQRMTKRLGRSKAQLTALEEKVEFLQPSGPYVRIRLPHQVLIDPNSSDPAGE